MLWQGDDELEEESGLSESPVTMPVPNESDVSPTSEGSMLGSVIGSVTDTLKVTRAAINTYNIPWRTGKELWRLGAKFSHEHGMPGQKEGESFDLQSLRGTHYEQYADSFLDIQFQDDADRLKNRIDSEIEDKEILEQASIPDLLVGMGVAYLLDPVQRTIFKAAAVGATAARSAIGAKIALGSKSLSGIEIGLKVIGAGAAAVGAQIATEEVTNLTEKVDHDKLDFNNLLSTYVMGTVLEGAMHLPYSKIGSKIKPAADRLYDVLMKPPVSWFANKAAVAKKNADLRAILEPRVMHGRVSKSKVSDMIARFTLGTVGQASPANRLAYKSLSSTQDLALELFSFHGIQEANMNGIATAPSAQVLIHRAQSYYYNVKKDILLEARKTSNITDWKTLQHEMSRALMQDGQHNNPGVAAATKRYINEIGGPLEDLLRGSKVIGPGPGPSNSPRYFPQIYDLTKIRKDQSGFEKLITDYILQDTASRAQEATRLAADIKSNKRLLRIDTGAATQNIKAIKARQGASSTMLQDREFNRILTEIGKVKGQMRTDKSGSLPQLRSTLKALRKQQKLEAFGLRRDIKTILTAIDPADTASIAEYKQLLASLSPRGKGQISAIKKSLRALRLQHTEAKRFGSMTPKEAEAYAGDLSYNIATEFAHDYQGDLVVIIGGSKSLGGSYSERKILIPQHLMLDYINTDFDQVTEHYIRKATADGVLAGKFGSHETLVGSESFKRIDTQAKAAIAAKPELRHEISSATTKSKKDLEGMFQRLGGRTASGKRRTPDDNFTNTTKALRGFASAAYLGQAVFSVIPDIASTVMVRGLTPVFRSLPISWLKTSGQKLAREELRSLHIGSTLTVRNMMSSRAFSDVLADIPHAASKWNKVHNTIGWLNAAQAMMNGTYAIELFRSRLLENVAQADVLWLCKELATGKIKPREAARLASVGIDSVKANEIYAAARQHGKISSGFAGVKKWGNKALEDFYINALYNNILKHDVTTSLLDTPFFADTELYKTVFQFSNWAYTLYNKVIVQGTQKSLALTAGTITSFVALRMFVDEVQNQYNSVMGNREYQNWSPAKRLTKGVIGTGLGGWPSIAMEKAERIIDQPYNTGNIILGPTASVATDLAYFVGQTPKWFTGEPLTERDRRANNQLIPLHKVFFLDKISRSLTGRDSHGARNKKNYRN